MTKQGLTMILTGDGKGKTTSAIGMIIRAHGHGLKTCLIQFIKSPDSGYGEINVLNQLGIEHYQIGAGCTWKADQNESARMAKKAWLMTQEKVKSGLYDLIVLDEINHLLHFPDSIGQTIISPEVLISLISTKPESLNLVLTGRYAHPDIIQMADTVSNIDCIRHHYHEGILAKAGIEY